MTDASYEKSNRKMRAEHKKETGTKMEGSIGKCSLPAKGSFVHADQ